MDEMNPVESLSLESVVDDAPQAQEETSTLESLVEESASGTEEIPAKEPGWIKQRVSKAVDKAVREAEQRVRAEYEAMLAPIREDVMDRQARELVSSGEFKSLERAKEYVRMKGGVPTTSAESAPDSSAQSRDDKGRFAPKPAEAEEDPVAKARADLLVQQAVKIKDARGLDVMKVFNDDPEVKKRILSGDWDFYDVAESMSTRKPPSPMRTPNGAGASGGISIANMTDEQFRKLQDNLANGRKYDVRK